MTTNQTIDGVLVSRELLCRVITTLEKPSEKWEQAGWPVASELRALLDKGVSGDSRAPQSQGEPVAPFGYWLSPKDQPALGRFHRVTPDDAIIDSDSVVSYFDITALYAEQPAPVAVVMPERMEARDEWDTESIQWNACLDEVKRLNP